MLCLDNTDTLEGGASVDAVVDYTIHGLVGTTFANVAQGQLSDTDPTILYTAGAAISIVSVVLVNTHSSAVIVNLYLDPANAGTPRRLIPKDFSLGIGYSLLYDGAKATVLNPTGGVVTSLIAHASDHTNGTDDVQTATNAQKGLMPSGVKDDYDDAVTKKHTQGTDTALGTQAENLDMGGHRSTNVGDAVDLHDGATLHDVLNSVGLVMNYWLMPTSLLSNELTILLASGAQEITGAAGETELTAADTFFKSTVANTPTPFVVKDGVIILIHFEAKVDSTSGTKPTTLHAELWRVDSDGSGTPQQIGSDSDETDTLTEAKTLYSLHLHAATEKIIVAGSRLWLRIFATTTGSNGNPTVRIYNGTVYGHVAIPVSGSILGRFLLLAGGIMTGDIAMDGSQQVTGLQAPDSNGEAIRATTKITESNLEDAIDKKHSNTTDHSQDTDTDLGGLGTKDPPIDADKVIHRDSENSDALVTSTWTQVKAFLKTYFDGIYGAGGDTDVIEMNILLLAFKIAVADSLTKFNMVDGVSDAFVDESGVDTGDSVNQSYDSGGDFYSPEIIATWSDTLNADVDLPGYTVRQVVAAASISNNGSVIRVTVEAASGATLVLDHVSIVERDSDANGTTTPTEILFSGTSGVTVMGGNVAVSDWLPYALDETKDYLLIGDLNGSDGDFRRISSGGDDAYYKEATDSYNVQNLAGAVLESGWTYLFSKLEVLNNMTLVSEATEAVTQPDEIRIVIMEEDVDTITINTNFFGDVSRDDGNNWVEVVLEKAVDYASGKQILSGVGNVSGQAADKTIRCRTRSTDNDDYKIHNWGMAWK